MPEFEVCALDELPAGTVRIVEIPVVKAGLPITIGVYNCGGELFALEDRCSHDDGPLCEGDFDPETGVAICPRHGANIDIRTGRPRTLPAVEPVRTFPVVVEDGFVKVDIA